MNELVKVIDKGSEEVLYSCDITKLETAYNYARDMEEAGLEIEIVIPSTPQTLLNSLGHSQEIQEQLKKEVNEELENH